MKQKVILFGLSIFLSHVLFSQERIPLIKANSTSVDIRDDKTLIKNAWTISTQLKPDIYSTSNKNKKVSFYTDSDSISFIVKPGKVYNFIILLNDKDSAFTQVKFEPKKIEPSYLAKLKKAATYNFSDYREVPKFTYQSIDDPNLLALRKGFNLDSIAGEAPEISKILNLLHWVHNLIPHDGNHENPTVKNAMSMMAQCKKENRGLNCRGLATVLNECYLALGIKSRFITCMPKDSVFDDCHVINMVYSNQFKKWLWIDPTNNAYVMNEKGELLSIAEVRERLSKAKPLILNPDANWNNKQTVVIEEYLYKYMAKNLYRMECPLLSEYDAETGENKKRITYIELLPLDAYHQTPQKTERFYPETKTTHISYITNNPALFWTAPN
jgi:hypothetical protein